MFPAHAGMNRELFRRIGWAGNVPRTRGDEPAASPSTMWTGAVVSSGNPRATTAPVSVIEP